MYNPQCTATWVSPGDIYINAVKAFQMICEVEEVLGRDEDDCYEPSEDMGSFLLEKENEDGFFARQCVIMQFPYSTHRIKRHHKWF